MNRRWVWVMPFVASLLCCGGHKVAGGSTVETDNAVSVQVIGMDGKPTSGALARIRPAWSVADTATRQVSTIYSRDIQTDSLGWIRCTDLPAGAYALEIISQGEGALLHFDRQDTSSYDSLGSVSLMALGSIKGKVTLPAGVKFAWIQIYGLDRAVKTDNLGNFRIDSLPNAILHIRAITSEHLSVIADDQIQVRPGYSWNVGTLTPASIYAEDPVTWQHSKTLLVSSLFSDWMLPITDPTVGFLRLDSTNFEFPEAMDDGRDLRFFDEQGNRLVYQRASWNSDLKTAVIRIRITGMPLSSKIEMRWGCDGAVDPSDEGLWEGIPDSVVQKLYTLDIADFEGNSLKSNITPSNGNHSWYLIAQDTTVVMSPKTDNTLPGIQPAEFGRSGNAFHVSSSGPAQKWALFGLVIDTIPADFGHLDSVVFWVRGNGTYQFALEKLTVVGGKAVFADSLDSIWTRKCIRPQDFIPGDGQYGNQGWEAMKHTITNISFFAYGDVDFWLDDVRIFGLNPDDLK